MTLQVNQRSYTITQYENLSDDGNSYELLEGKLIMTPPPGDQHGSISATLGYFIAAYNRLHKTGKLWINSRFVIESGDPASELAPDLAFIALADVPKSSSGAIPRPPHLAIEIKSPGDSLPEMRHKAAVYIKAGVQLVWLIIPEKKTVIIYETGASQPLTLQESDNAKLEGGAVLPGFELNLTELFEDL